MIDPQERLFLEVAWNVLEDAGYTPENVVEGARDVGVFVGVMAGNYQLFGAEEAVKGNRVIAASWYYSIANRVSYCFDFQGPSMAIDTACSASLAAIHLACMHLRRGDCRAAIAAASIFRFIRASISSSAMGTSRRAMEDAAASVTAAMVMFRAKASARCC